MAIWSAGTFLALIAFGHFLLACDPLKHSHPVALTPSLQRWANGVCGYDAPAATIEFENDYGPASLYTVTCANGVPIEAAGP